MFEIFLMLAFFALAAAGILQLRERITKAAGMLHRWADENRYRILSYQYKHFLQGPFFMATSRCQVVFHVTIQTSNGETRKAWVQCGAFMEALSEYKVFVLWAK